MPYLLLVLIVVRVLLRLHGRAQGVNPHGEAAAVPPARQPPVPVRPGLHVTAVLGRVTEQLRRAGQLLRAEVEADVLQVVRAGLGGRGPHEAHGGGWVFRLVVVVGREFAVHLAEARLGALAQHPARAHVWDGGAGVVVGGVMGVMMVVGCIDRVIDGEIHPAPR